MCFGLKPKGLPDLCLVSPVVRGVAFFLKLEYNVPYLMTHCQTIAYSPTKMPFGLPALSFGLHYYVIYNVVIPADYRLQDPFIAFARDGLKLITCRVYSEMFKRQALPHVILFSPLLATVVYPTATSNYQFVATTVIQQDAQVAHVDSFGGAQEKKKLEDFLNAGPTKPVYLGWGSMLIKSLEFMVETAARAIHHSKQWAIVMGWEGRASIELLAKTGAAPEIIEYAKKNILFIGGAPHEWLFPRVAMTVTHGGAGTATAAFRSGVPSIITPVFGDQYDHADVVNEFNVGIGFSKSMRDLNWLDIGEAIEIVALNPEMAKNAADLASKLRKEDGANGAVDAMESFWEEYCVTGKFHQIFSELLAKETDAMKHRTTKLVVGTAAAGLVAAVAVSLLYKGK